MKIHLERIEGQLAVGKDETGERVTFELGTLPKGVQGFHVLDVTDGVTTIDEAETEQRRLRVRELLEEVFREANGKR